MRQIRIECFLQFIRNIITDKDPEQQLAKITKLLNKEIFSTKPASKHLSGKKIGRMKPTQSLKWKNEEVCLS
jgi:hypothetical protein